MHLGAGEIALLVDPVLFITGSGLAYRFLSPAYVLLKGENV
jgi:hypothetical protein